MMRLTRWELYFYIGMAIQFIMSAYLITIQRIPHSLIFVIGIVMFLGLKILHTRYSRREMVIIGVLLIISSISYIYQTDSKVLRISLMFIAAKDIPRERFLKFLLVAYLMILIYVPVICLFAGKGTISMYGTFGIGRQAATRYMLGFDGPNRLAGVWLCLLATIYISLEKRKFWIDLILFALSCGLYYLNRSRTGLIAVTVLILVPYIYKFGPRLVKTIIHKKALLWALILVLVLTIGSTLANGDLMDRLNTVFNNRISNLSNIYASERITIWGSDFDFQIYGGGMDNSYFAVLYTDGLIPTAMYVIAILKYISVIQRKDDITELSIALTFILIAYVQEMIDVPFINYMLILFGINWNEMMDKSTKRSIRSWKRVNTENIEEGHKKSLAQ